jgi:DNA-binding NtrC family response regulator
VPEYKKNNITFRTTELELVDFYDDFGIFYEDKKGNRIDDGFRMIPAFLLQYIEEEFRDTLYDDIEADIMNPETTSEMLLNMSYASNTYKLAGIIKAAPTSLLDITIRRKCFEKHKGPLFLYGERGSGKELYARYFFETGLRQKQNMVSVNCATLNDGLLMSNLFGHKKGAFTGAGKDHKGFFEQANGGVLFLDEIHHLTLEAQGALLRVIEYGSIHPVGSEEDIKVDVQVYAATNVHPDVLYTQQLNGTHRFLPDLLDRLMGGHIQVQTLQESDNVDKRALATYFILQGMKEYDLKELTLDVSIFLTLYNTPYEGNTRDLRNRCYSIVRESWMPEDYRIKSFYKSLSPGTKKRLRERGQNMVSNKLDKLMDADDKVKEFYDSEKSRSCENRALKGYMFPLKDILDEQWMEARNSFKKHFIKYHKSLNPNINDNVLASKIGMSASTLSRSR